MLLSIGVFVVYIGTGSSMPISPSKSRDLADENNKILTEWKWSETTILPGIFPLQFQKKAVLTFDPQLKKILTFSVKDRYQLNYFICIKDFNAEKNTSLKLNI
jgi:cobalamin-dependent methionine synthase I